MCISQRSPAEAHAAVVHTRDGKTFEGTIRMEAGGLIIHPANGPDTRIDLSAVRHAIFQDHTDAQRQAHQSPAQAKPAEKPSRVEGLRAEYYASYDLTDLRLIRIDPKIDNWWSEHTSPDPAVPEEFSARWTGQIAPAHSETYTLRVGLASGGRFWLDNRLVVDNWNGPGTFTTKLEAKAGQRYDVKLEFRKGRWGGSAKLIWKSNHQPEEAIPSKYLYPPAGTHPPTVAIRSPRDGQVLIAPAAVLIEADAADADGSVRKVEFFANDRSIGTVEQSPWRLEWKNASPGHHRLTARATDDAGISALSESCQVVIGGNIGGDLPNPWMEFSVGQFEPLGSARYANNTFTLRGTDGDLWSERDRLYYVCQPLPGDGSIVARVKSFEAIHGSGAGAGLLIREHLSNQKARQAFLGFVCDAGIAFIHRQNLWEERKRWEEAAQPPHWLKLTRHGTRITAYRSEDGRDWKLLGERNIEMPSTAFIGLAIANPVSEVGAAAFDQVAVTLGLPPMESTTRGVLLRNGSLIAGKVHFADDTSVKLSRPNQELIVPTSQVARILIKPLTREALQHLHPGRTGVILNNGDFVDGNVSFKDGHVRVSSVVFGMRRFNTWDETIAAVLRPIQPATCRYEIAATDGSHFRAQSIEIDAGKLKLVDSLDLALTLNSSDVAEIRAIDSP